MRIAKLDMSIYDRYITYVELSSACSAPHTQYKSQTKLTKKVVPHRENLTPYKERVSLGGRRRLDIADCITETRGDHSAVS